MSISPHQRPPRELYQNDHWQASQVDSALSHTACCPFRDSHGQLHCIAFAHKASPSAEKGLSSLKRSYLVTNEVVTDAAFDHWENEGGALACQGRECLPIADCLSA